MKITLSPPSCESATQKKNRTLTMFSSERVITAADEVMSGIGTMFAVIAISCASFRDSRAPRHSLAMVSDALGAMGAMALLIPRRRFCFAINSARAAISASATVVAILRVSPGTIDLVARPAIQFALAIGAMCVSGSWIARHPKWESYPPVFPGSVIAYLHATIWVVTILLIQTDRGARPFASIASSASLLVAFAAMIAAIRNSRGDDLWDLIRVERWGRFPARTDSILFAASCIAIALVQIFVLVLPLIGPSACPSDRFADCRWPCLTLIFAMCASAASCAIWAAKFALAIET